MYRFYASFIRFVKSFSIPFIFYSTLSRNAMGYCYYKTTREFHQANNCMHLAHLTFGHVFTLFGIQLYDRFNENTCFCRDSYLSLALFRAMSVHVKQWHRVSIYLEKWTLIQTIEIEGWRSTQHTAEKMLFHLVVIKPQSVGNEIITSSWNNKCYVPALVFGSYWIFNGPKGSASISIWPLIYQDILIFGC